MTKPAPKNFPASVRQKLANLARERNVDFGLILVKYGLETYSLPAESLRPHRDVFILKGVTALRAVDGTTLSSDTGR